MPSRACWDRVVIAIDTNVIIRSLIDDDAAQSEAAKRLLGGLTAENPGYVCREAMVEFVWVLERVYRLPRSTIGTAILDLIASDNVIVENDEAMTHAAYRYMQGGVDFADLMILAAANHQRATPLYTFDRKLARLEGVSLLGAS